MKLNDLKMDVDNLVELFGKVASEINTQVSALEKIIVESQAATANPDVPQDIVDGLAKIRAIGEALDAMNPDVEPVVEDTPLPSEPSTPEEVPLELPIEPASPVELPVFEVNGITEDQKV